MEGAHILEGALEFILAASRNVYPREFTAQLRMEGDVITDVLITPKSTYGQGFAVTRLDMIPIDRSIKGSVHSHPSQSFNPSGADIRFFRKTGTVHLIVKYPYKSIEDVAGYDMNGERIPLLVVREDE